MNLKYVRNGVPHGKVVTVDAESKDVLLLFTEFPNWAKRNKHYAGNSNDKIIEEAKYRINVVLFVQ